MTAATLPTVGVDLTGRRAVVTGAANGIGAACARRLAAAGAIVVLVDRDAEALAAVAGELDATAYVADLTDRGWLDDLDPAFDIVVNNAGVQHVAPVPEFAPDMFGQLIRVLLEAPFQLVHRVLPHMYAGGWGRVVNISSVHGHRASPFKAAYVAAKHGLEGLSKVIALESGPYGVTSNTIAPAYVRTALVERQIATQAAYHGTSEAQVVQDVMLRRSVIKRLVEPTEVAEFAAFLCSPAADFVTGSSFPLDGGWMAQ